MKYLLPFFIVFGCFFNLNAQLKVGDWRMHISSYKANDLIEANDAVYVVLDKGLLEYDLSTGEKNLWTAADYLSDVNLTAINYHEKSKRIIIGYDNGNIDFIRNNKVENFPYIFKSNVMGNKQINKIISRDDYVYCATSLGIIVIDMVKREVKDTYHPAIGDFNFLDLTFLDDKIYVLTEEGLYEGNSNNSFLADPSQWTRLPNVIDHTDFGAYHEVEAFGDKLILSYSNTTFGNSDSLYHIENGVPVVFDSLKTFYGLNGEGSELLVSTYDALHIFSAELDHLDLIFQYDEGIAPKPRTAKFIDGYYFIADRNKGLVRALNSWSHSIFNIEGPRYNSGYRAEIKEGKLSVACGGFTGTNPTFNLEGGALFEDEVWKSVVIDEQPMLANVNSWDFVATSINPKDMDEVAFGSVSGVPLVITKNGEVTDTFTINNSPIEELSSTGWGLITDLRYDDDGNLWMVNSSSNRPVKVLGADGVWNDFETGNSSKNQTTKRLIVDRNGVKWVTFRNAGVLAFDSGKSLSDLSDDRYRQFNTGDKSGALPSNDVEAIAADFDNNIWIGTPEGMRVLYNSENVFDAAPGKYNFQKLLIQFGAHVEIVLGTTHITAITVDGANRKWIGTANSGVFLLSPDGLEVLKKFTIENSPLLSNTIYDIVINHQNGEVFFMTEDGIISYRSDATQGDIEYQEVKVFPNPVYPEYHGPITIQGIAYDSDVKITDVSGKLVYQTKSNGGTATWNGLTMDGNRAATGVYLIWTSIDDNDFKGRKVGKVLLID